MTKVAASKERVDNLLKLYSECRTKFKRRIWVLIENLLFNGVKFFRECVLSDKLFNSSLSIFEI